MKNYSFTTANVSLLRNSFYNFYLFWVCFLSRKDGAHFLFFFCYSGAQSTSFDLTLGCQLWTVSFSPSVSSRRGPPSDTWPNPLNLWTHVLQPKVTRRQRRSFRGPLLTVIWRVCHVSPIFSSCTSDPPPHLLLLSCLITIIRKAFDTYSVEPFSWIRLDDVDVLIRRYTDADDR